jgi:hypothetical protein
MPDITPMQKLVGALTAVITIGLETATSFGAGLTVNQDTKLLALWGALSAFALTADAIIRQGRAKHLAIVKAAQINAAAAAAQTVHTSRTVIVTKPAPPARKPGGPPATRKPAAKRTTKPKATT